MSDWGLQTGSVNTTSWVRSWRQELFTDLGKDFSFVAHIEQVTTFESGQEPSHKALGQVVRRMSEVKDDPDVQQLQVLLTTLVKKWIDEDTAKAIG